MRLREYTIVFYVLAFFLICSGVWAQSDATLRGTIVKPNNKAVLFCNVALLNMKTQSLTGGGVTDSLGNFQIEHIAPGYYSLQVHYIGFDPYKQDSLFIRRGENLTLDTLVIRRKRTRLDEVQVTARRPFIEQGLGQTTINVGEHIAGAGESAIDLMRFVPSVTTDEDNNVLLRGAPVTILVDGVETDLANVLEQLPAETVDKLEIITNPSAKYSSRNGNGIINIVLKKDKIKGSNGRLEAAIGTPERYVASANYTLRMKKWTSYTNVSYKHNTDEVESLLNRSSVINNDTSYLNNAGFTERETDDLMVRQGFKYQIDKSQFVDVRGMYKSGFQNYSTINSSFNRRADSTLKSHNETQGKGERQRFFWELNGRWKKSFNNKASLNVFAKYEQQRNDAPSFRTIQPYDVNDATPKKDYSTQERGMPEEIESTRLNIDYEHPLGKKLKLEAGATVLYRYSKADNIFLKTKYTYRQESEDYEVSGDDSRNNSFSVEELSPALYTVVSTELKEVFISAGLRYEYTTVEPYSITADSGVHQTYHHLLPTVQFSRKFGEKCNVGLSWSKRIKQPKYKQLNPFVVYNGLYSKSGGNPELKPQKTTNTELTVHWQLGKHAISPSVFWKENTDMFNQYQYLVVEDGRDIMFRQFMNLGNSRELGAELNLSNRISDHWDIKSNFLVMHQDIEGVVKDNAFKVADYAYSGKITSDLILGKSFRIQLTGAYESPVNTITGRRFEYYFIDMGLRKAVLKKKGSLYLKYSDVFDNMERKRMTNSADGIIAYNTSKAITRRLLLSFSYKFSKINK
ncbi:TonB-dependent receptor domain-containing protein [Carboxylicivirga sp. RSCT41]|uniref:TonB-dependent receptor domain-containing protein n=1 Tax=Carboxylicivirga agarovorans TaxID=3417570 RepID=UPI003D348B53